jgi:hypothetical protein
LLLRDLAATSTVVRTQGIVIEHLS